MARINSRKKGSRGEKLAIEFLTEWTGLKYVRVPQSGGLRWKNTTNSVGDIICDEPNYIFPMTIEAKFYEDINFEHLLYNPANKERKMARIKEFWFQARADARRGKKVPMLMMRYNNLPRGLFFVVFSHTTWEYLYHSKIRPKPFMNFDNKIVITHTQALLEIDWAQFEVVMMRRLRQLYG